MVEKQVIAVVAKTTNATDEKGDATKRKIEAYMLKENSIEKKQMEEVVKGVERTVKGKLNRKEANGRSCKRCGKN